MKITSTAIAWAALAISIFLLIAFICLGSNKSRSLDGMLVMDSSGNYYKIERHIGDTFTVKTIGNFSEFKKP